MRITSVNGRTYEVTDVTRATDGEHREFTLGRHVAAADAEGKVETGRAA